MKRSLLNILFIVLAFTVQHCIFPLLPFLSASPNLLLILVFTLGFIYGRDAGLLYGVIAGILLDLFGGGPFGFYTLVFIYIGYVNGIWTKYYYEDYITLPLILCMVNELIYNLYIYVFRFLLRNRLDFIYYLKAIIIPEIIFTVVMTLFFYRLLLFTSRRLEVLDKRGASDKSRGILRKIIGGSRGILRKNPDGNRGKGRKATDGSREKSR